MKHKVALSKLDLLIYTRYLGQWPHSSFVFPSDVKISTAYINIAWSATRSEIWTRQRAVTAGLMHIRTQANQRQRQPQGLTSSNLSSRTNFWLRTLQFFPFLFWFCDELRKIGNWNEVEGITAFNLPRSHGVVPDLSGCAVLSTIGSRVLWNEIFHPWPC